MARPERRARKITMPSSAVKPPEYQSAYLQIRDMILFGNLVPGQSVTLSGLAETMQTGMMPVRDAVRRLTAEGALEAGGNRRVTVPEMTLDALNEIAFARLTIEPRLTELAAAQMTDACLAELEAFDAEVDAAIEAGNVERYLEYNYRFHFRLYEQSDAKILIKIAASLWLQFGPSLRIVCGRFGTANLPDMHSEALEALRAQDIPKSVEAISTDIRQGLDQVRLSKHHG